MQYFITLSYALSTPRIKLVFSLLNLILNFDLKLNDKWML
jgi:hypothetical protein